MKIGDAFDGYAQPRGSLEAVPVTTSAINRYLPIKVVDEACALVKGTDLGKLDRQISECQDVMRTSEALVSKPLESMKEYVDAGELISRGGIALKELDALRRKLVDPLNAQVKRINALFHTVTDPVTARVGSKGDLERNWLAFRRQEDARRAREQEAARLAQEEAAQREAAAVADAAAASSPSERHEALRQAEKASQEQTAAAMAAPREMTKGLRTDSGAVSERQHWTFQVVDDTKIPREYMTPDLLQIGKEVRAGILRELPGVHIYPEDRITRRVG